MSFNAKKLLLAGTAIVAAGAFGAAGAQAADLTTSSSVIFASSGGQTSADVANAKAGDNVAISGASTLTITNNNGADDGSGKNTFDVGAVTGTGNLAIQNGLDAKTNAAQGTALVVTVDSFDLTGNVSIQNRDADDANLTVTFGGDSEATGTLGIVNNESSAAKTVVVDFDGDLTVGGAATITGGGFAGATTAVKIAGDATFTGGVTMTDGTASATVTFDGSDAQTVTGAIDGNADGKGNIVVSNAEGVTFASKLGDVHDLAKITVAATDGTNSSATFTNTVAATNLVLGNGSGTDTNTITFDTTDNDYTVTGALDGTAGDTGNVVVSGGGTVTTSGAWGGTTALDDISVGADTTLSAGGNMKADTFTLASGSVLQTSGAATLTGDINGAGTLDIDANTTVVGNVGDSTALTAITVADQKTLTIDAATAGADLTVAASSIVLQDATADGNETVLALTPGAKNITVSAPITTGVNGDGRIDITDSTDDDNVISFGDAIGTSSAKLDRLATANGGNNVDTVRASHDLYVNSILIDGSDVLQLRGSNQTVSGTINGNATDSDGFVEVGDGTNAAEVTFGGAIGTTNDIDSFTVKSNATANISHDLIMASTGANGGLLVDGTLNIDSTGGAITIDNTTNGDIDFNGTVNVTGSNSVGIASTDTTSLDGVLSTVLSGTSKTLTLSSDGNHLDIGKVSDTTITAGNQIILNSTATTIGATGRTTTLLIQKTADFDPTNVAGIDAVLDADTANSVVTVATDGTLQIGVSADSAALENGDVINVIEGGATNATTSYATLLTSGAIQLVDTGLLDLQDNSSDASTLSVKVAYKDASEVFGDDVGASAAQALMDFSGATDELQTARENLLTAPTADAAQDVAESISPTVDGGNVTGAMDASTQVFGVTSTRLASLRDGGQSGVAAGSMPVGSHFWGQVFGQSANQDKRNGVDGFDSDTYGLAVGADAEAMDGAGHLGAALSYARTNVDSDSANTTSTDIDSYQLTLYGDMDLANNMYLSGMAAYAWNSNNTTRHDVGGISGLNADGDFNADQFSTKVELGRPYAMEGGLTLTPMAMADYMYYSAEDYTETGAGTANLHIDQDSVSKLDVGVGAEAVWTLQNSDGSFLKPGLNAGYRYDLIGDDIQSTSSFTGGGSSFQTDGIDPARSQFDVGASLQYLTTDNWDFSAQYNYEFKSDYDAHSGLLRAAYKF